LTPLQPIEPLRPIEPLDGRQQLSADELQQALDELGIRPVDLSGVQSQLDEIERCQRELADYARDLEFYNQFGGVEPSDSGIRLYCR
jgi:chaperonin cofactor prefoldin